MQIFVQEFSNFESDGTKRLLKTFILYLQQYKSSWFVVCCVENESQFLMRRGEAV